jgi:hypothetical protein
MAVTTIGPVWPASTIENEKIARQQRARLGIQAERDAGAVVTLVTIGLVLANVFLWAMLAGS